MTSQEAAVFGLMLLLSQVAGGGLQSTADSATRDREGDVVAVINGVSISRAEVDQRILVPLARLEQQMLQLRQQALESLIEKRLIDQEAMRRGLEVSDLEQLEITARQRALRGSAGGLGTTRPQASAQRSSASPETVPPIERESLRASWIEDLRRRATIAMRLTPTSLPRANVTAGDSPGLGAERPKVTIIEYSDFQCAFCRAMRLPLKQLVSKHSDVRLVYRHMPLDGLHPTARRAAEASYCAQNQGRFWEYHDELFQETSAFSDRLLLDLARRVGLDEQKLATCLSGDNARRAVRKDTDEAAALGIEGTPTLLINGRVVVGQARLGLLERIIAEEREIANNSTQPQ